MPSGPPELHEKWCNAGPYHDNGDMNAQHYLTSRGWIGTFNFFWVKPTEDHVATDEENSALNYLCWEWDFGGIITARTALLQLIQRHAGSADTSRAIERVMNATDQQIRNALTAKTPEDIKKALTE